MRRFGALVMLLLLSNVSHSQVSSDPPQWREVLDRARGALNDLQYRRADTLARDVLALGSRTPRNGRMEALRVLAAANYPESESDRRVAQARSALVQLLRLDLDAGMSRDLTWPGLDSLFSDVARTTYAVSVLVRRENPIVGISGTANLRVRANRRSSFVLSARTLDGIESIVLDSVSSATDTTLSLRVSRGNRPLLHSGEYDFVVTATDVTTRESFARVFDGVTIIPALDYLTVPTAVDTSALKPQRLESQRVQGMVAGFLVAAGTIALGKTLHSTGAIHDSGQSDGRYIGVGVVMLVGTAAAAWFDHGRLLDKNIAANERAKADLANRRQAAIAENGKRAAEYKASITLNPEPR